MLSIRVKYRPYISGHCPRWNTCRLVKKHQVSASVNFQDFGNLPKVELPTDVLENLEAMLVDEDLLSHVEKAGRLVDRQHLKFTGLLFEPVPWSPSTPKGMPQEYEQFYGSNDHLIINVPPTVMFKAKIFKPSRLCAIYEIVE